jgi:predicted ArsR family transcriptional regulator
MEGATPTVSFGSARQAILEMLKRRGELSLREVSVRLGVSKVAALRHLSILESHGLVVRSFHGGPRGRPPAYFRLSAGAASLFPAAYAAMSLYALEFLEEKLGRPAVLGLLRRRTQELFRAYRARINQPDLRSRIAELAKAREEGGYMAELGPTRGNTYQMLEHHCPILAIAGRYGEACEVERQLFRSVLRADVQVSHRAAVGDPVCRFLIRPSSETTV